MPAFHYIALDASGSEKKGVLEADSIKHARQLLRERQLIPLETTTTRTKLSHVKRKFRLPWQKGLNAKELALITRQLATLLSAGLPLEEVIGAVAEQTEKPGSKGLLLSVRSKVVEGHSLANALREHPQAFSNLYAATVAAGEKTGHLDKILQRLADYTEQQFSLRQKIQHALIYPSIMVAVSFGIVAFLLAYVVPKMVDVYDSIHQALPTITTVLIAISNAVQALGLYFILLSAAGVYGFTRYMQRNPALRERVDTLLLKLPLIGNAIKIINTGRFARTLAILTSSGVSVLEAMFISSELVSNIPIRKALETATERVREGASIHLALKQTRYFQPMSLHLIASGEASGQLDAMLERAALNQENDIRQWIETSLALFEPAIILVMGAIVLFIVLAILLPIFQLDQLTG